MKHTRATVREIRKNLAVHLHSGLTTAVVSSTSHGGGQLRAFLVSIPDHPEYDRGARRKAIAKAKRTFQAALRAEKAAAD